MSDDVTNLTNRIVENASTPQSITTRDGAVTSQDLAEQRNTLYLLASINMTDAFSAMRPRKMVPPSAIGSAIQSGP